MRADEPADPRLVAYVVLERQEADEKSHLIRQLRTNLQERLPEYMVPAAFVILDALPLTPNGKVDRQALPAPEGDALAAEAYLMPQTEAERRLAVLWQDLLHLEKVGMNDNFFSLGGHSLLLVKLQAQLNEQFDPQLTLVDLFKYPTIKALAEYLSQRQSGDRPAS